MHTNSTVSRRQLIFVLILFLFCNLFVNAQEKHYRVTINANNNQLQTLIKKGFEADHFHYQNGKVIAEISKSDINLLKENNIKFKINIRNLEKRIHKINKKIDKQNAKSNVLLAVPTPANFELGTMGGFHKFDEAIAALDKMRQLYPELITVKSSIGTTEQGRSIYMVKISDNADTDENEDEMLFTSIHHAREPMGLSQNLFYMWYLLENYNSNDEIKTLVDNTELYFIPVINPDGYTYNQQTNPNGGGFWRKNRSNNGNGTFGVDLNRNYSYRWGGASNNTNSQTYQGPSGFSELETQAIRDFTNQHEFIAALNYHSFSNLLIHPWGYSSNTFTPDQSTFVAMGNYMTEENSYAVGTPNQTVGYNATGSSDDWMYGEQTSKPKMLSMTPEVGASSDGFWPASSRIIPLCNDAFPLNIKITRMIARYAKVTPTTDSQTINSTAGSVDFSIRRFSLKQSNWTVSLSSTSSYVSSAGTAKQFNSIPFLDTDTGNISFQLDPNTPSGTVIPITLTVDNGSWQYTKSIDITYTGTGGDTEPPSIPSGLSVSNITSSSLTLSWNAATDNIGVTGYDIYQANTLVSSSTGTTTNLTGLASNTAFQFSIKAKDAAGNVSDFSNAVTATTLPANISYCSASANNTSDEYISNVQIGTINNTSAAENGGYSDFTSIATTLSKGVSNTITITPTWTGTVYREAYSVWIDYNRDGDFNDSGEQVWSKPASRTTPLSGNFTVPANALEGNTRMRVIMRYNRIPSACGTFTYGEVEDYTITIATGATAAQLVKSSVNENSIKIYPVPTKNVLNITLPNKGVYEYAIVDLLGKTATSGTFSNSINTQKLAAGTYILKVIAKEGTYTKQFIKED
ncbi:hypothetical protein AWE51_18435 [Aquimarina aggregata]|uniref:carboxypeptidase T n=1 Tax=Aquimarina aggregata TaxID=1642818 RepID=A0A165SBZ1_9FLAO|nr:M14 family zinc carboxypeptidase [Aquimarina aggregata]KZS38024.1 hypothetical protein AWE51_18435 [Aquimarina aggregata]